jgi:hypothetical protein
MSPPLEMEWACTSRPWRASVTWDRCDATENPGAEWLWALEVLHHPGVRGEFTVVAGGAHTFREARRLAMRELRAALRGERDADRNDMAASLTREPAPRAGGLR